MRQISQYSASYVMCAAASKFRYLFVIRGHVFCDVTVLMYLLCYPVNLNKNFLQNIKRKHDLAVLLDKLFHNSRSGVRN